MAIDYTNSTVSVAYFTSAGVEITDGTQEADGAEYAVVTATIVDTAGDPIKDAQVRVLQDAATFDGSMRIQHDQERPDDPEVGQVSYTNGAGVATVEVTTLTGDVPRNLDIFVAEDSPGFLDTLPRPTASTTGIREATTSTQSTALTVTTPTTYENVKFEALVTVESEGVNFIDCEFDVSGGASANCVRVNVTPDDNPVTFQRCTFTGSSSAAIRGRGFKVTGALIEKVGGAGVQVVYQGTDFATEVIGSLIREVGSDTPSPCILLDPGASVRLRGNALEGWSESSAAGSTSYAGRGAVHAFTTKPQVSTDILIDRNWCEGGTSYIVRSEATDNGNPPTGVRVIGNRFGDPAQYGGTSPLNIEGVGQTIFGNLDGVTGRLSRDNEIEGALFFPIDAESLDTQATVLFQAREAPLAPIDRVFPLPSSYQPTSDGVTQVPDNRTAPVGQVYRIDDIGERTDSVAASAANSFGWTDFRDAIPTARLSPPTNVPEQSAETEFIAWSAASVSTYTPETADIVLTIENRDGSGDLMNATDDVVVTLAYSGSATKDTDYTAPDSATITAGSSSTTITVSPIHDTENEVTELILIEIESVTGGATIGSDDTASITLADVDYEFGEIAPATTVVNFDVTQRTITEGQGTTFRISCTRDINYDIDVTYEITSGGLDIGTELNDPSGGTITIPAADTAVNLTITTNDDSVQESSEQAFIELTGASRGAGSGGTLLPVIGNVAVATLTVEDDDTPPTQAVGFDTTVLSIVEGGVSTLFLTLPNASSQDIVVPYTLTEGTGLSSSEYELQNLYSGEPLASPITIPAGVMQIPISVTSVDDDANESNETLTITLGAVTSGPGELDPAKSECVVTFEDNDNAGATGVDGELYGLAPERQELDLSTADMEVRSGEYEVFANPGLGISGSTTSASNPLAEAMRAAVTIWEAKNSGDIAALQAVSGRLDEGEVVKIRVVGDLRDETSHSFGTISLPLGGDDREVYWADYPYVRDLCIFGDTGPSTDIIGSSGNNSTQDSGLVVQSGTYAGRPHVSANIRFENIAFENSPGGQTLFRGVGGLSNADGEETVHGRFKFYDSHFNAPRELTPSSSQNGYGIKWIVRSIVPASWDFRGCVTDLAEEHFIYVNAPQGGFYCIECANRPFIQHTPGVPEGFPRTFSQIVDRPVSEPCRPGYGDVVWIRNTITNGNAADFTVAAHGGEIYMVDNRHVGEATNNRGVCEIWAPAAWDIQGMRRFTDNGVDYTTDTVHVWNEQCIWDGSSGFVTNRHVFGISGSKAVEVRGFNIGGALGGNQFEVDRTSSREFINGEPAWGPGHGWFWDLRDDGIQGSPLAVDPASYSGFQETGSSFRAKMLNYRNCAWHFVQNGNNVDRHILTDAELNAFDGSAAWGSPGGFPEAKWSKRTLGIPVGASVTLYYGDTRFSRSRYQQTISYTRLLTNVVETTFTETIETPGIVTTSGGGSAGDMVFTYMDEENNADAGTPDERPEFTITANEAPPGPNGPGIIRYRIDSVVQAEQVSNLADVYIYAPASFGTFSWEFESPTLSLSDPAPYEFFVISTVATQMNEFIDIEYDEAASTTSEDPQVINYDGRNMEEGQTVSRPVNIVDPQNLRAGDTIVLNIVSVEVDGITAGNIGTSQMTINVVA